LVQELAWTKWALGASAAACACPGTSALVHRCRQPGAGHHVHLRAGRQL